MMNTFLRMLTCLVLAGFAIGTSAEAAAEELLVVVAEEMANPEGDATAEFWWSGSTPAWTPTDVALREAMRSEGSGFAEPRSTQKLSKIYRVPALSDSSALAMASVFGRRRVLVGTIQYAPTALRPVGLHGWGAQIDIRLVERSEEGPVVRHRVSFRRSRWGMNSEEALATLRTDVAEQVARSVAGGLERKIGPVGIDSEEVLIGLRSAGERAVVDAVIARMKTFAGVTDVTFRWAAEGQIVLEVNPGEVDPESSVRQYASLLSAEEFEDFHLTSSKAGNSVILFRVEENL